MTIWDAAWPWKSIQTAGLGWNWDEIRMIQIKNLYQITRGNENSLSGIFGQGWWILAFHQELENLKKQKPTIKIASRSYIDKIVKVRNSYAW